MSYRSVTLKRVFESAVRLNGLDPEISRLTSGQRGRYAELINDRLRIAWEAELWPELLTVERRQYAPTYDASTEYSEDDVRFYTDGTSEGYFTSLQDSNTGNTPSFTAATAWWEEVGDDFIHSISFEQSWESNVIGALDVKCGVFARDPRLYINERPMDACRIISGAALLVSDRTSIPARPWIQYRKPAPEITLTPKDLGVNYAVGELAYDEVTGDAYKALTANSNTLVSDSSAWERVRIPWVFSEYIKHGVAADLKMEDEGRLRSEARANQELDRVRDTQFEQRGETRKVIFGRNQ